MKRISFNMDEDLNIQLKLLSKKLNCSKQLLIYVILKEYLESISGDVPVAEVTDKENPKVVSTVEHRIAVVDTKK